MTKLMLTPDAIESQAIFELPERKLPLVTVIITNLLNDLSIDVDVKNNNVAVQVCAVVQALNAIVFPSVLVCGVEQD